MIVQIQQFEPTAPSHARRSQTAQQFAERYSLYQDRHSDLMFALWDDTVCLDAFSGINDDLRRLAFELKKLRMELGTR